jgi:hypothetical protein
VSGVDIIVLDMHSPRIHNTCSAPPAYRPAVQEDALARVFRSLRRALLRNGSRYHINSCSSRRALQLPRLNTARLLVSLLTRVKHRFAHPRLLVTANDQPNYPLPGYTTIRFSDESPGQRGELDSMCAYERSFYFVAIGLVYVCTE